MLLAIEVTAVPDNPRAPTSTTTQKIRLSPDTVEKVLSGKLPFRYQIFVEAAVPEMIRGVLREAEANESRKEVPSR